MTILLSLILIYTNGLVVPILMYFMWNCISRLLGVVLLVDYYKKIFNSYLQILQIHHLNGSDSLILLAHLSMKLLFENGFDENICLSLLTSNPAKILGLENTVGKLDIGMSADFLVSDGILGLDITDLIIYMMYS